MIQRREKDWNLKEEKDVGKRNHARRRREKNIQIFQREKLSSPFYSSRQSLSVPLITHVPSLSLRHAFVTTIDDGRDEERGGRKVHVLSRMRMQVARKMVMRWWKKKRGVSEKERQNTSHFVIKRERCTHSNWMEQKRLWRLPYCKTGEKTRTPGEDHTRQWCRHRGVKEEMTAILLPPTWIVFYVEKKWEVREKCLSFTCLSFTSPKYIGKGETFKTTPLPLETVDLCSKRENHSHSTNTSCLLLSTTSSQVIKRLTFERS